MSFLVTAISRHICDLLNIREGKFCFSLPEDLSVKDYFCIFIIVPCLFFCRTIQDTGAKSCACARHETAPLTLTRITQQYGFRLWPNLLTAVLGTAAFFWSTVYSASPSD